MKNLKLFIMAILAISLLLSGCSLHKGSSEGEKYMQLYEKENQNGNNAQALKYLQLAVEEDNTEALARLGGAYLHGRYGLKSPEKAFPILEDAARAGNTRAMTDLGTMYLYGTGTKKDYALAFSWLDKAAKAGDMKAPRYLGLIFENGWGKESDNTLAAQYYQEAADRGDITGQYELGRLYEKGMGVTQDYQKAYNLYQKSAARSDIISLPVIMALGNMLELGLGVEKNMETALDWYRKGAALGDVTAKAKIAAILFPDNPFILDITALVKILGDGQKIAAIAIEYKEPIDPTSVQTGDFIVPGRKITSVYVSNEAAMHPSAQPGNFVIVALETSIDKASVSMGGEPQHRRNARPDKNNNQPNLAGPQLGEKPDKPATPVALTARICQSGKLNTQNGQIIVPSPAIMHSNKTFIPDIQGFKQLVYHDAKYNKDLMYNLYIPAHYDPAKKYPLVLFMHDAGAVSNNPTETLTQGLGAIIWASPGDQAKHETFVLAPQYNEVIADDNSKTTADMDITVHLLETLMKTYNIDAKRLYNTGQSMGGMTSIAMDIKYPDLFAASLLVACQWNPALVKPLANKPLWIVVSSGDNKAKPGMDAITGVLKNEGRSVAKSTWLADTSAESLQKDVEALLNKHAEINYTIFKGGSHRYTWIYAYSISGIRDWLFEQHR